MAVDEQPGITKYFKKASPLTKRRSPSPPRAPSPPHDYVLADNPDIAVSIYSLVTFFVFGRALTRFFFFSHTPADLSRRSAVHRDVPRAFQ